MAKRFEVTRKRIREIEAKALRKLRHPTRAKILWDAAQAVKDPGRAEELHLIDLSLTEVPAFITNYSRIRSLSFYGNELTTLPEFIRRLTRLEEINLDHNGFTTLPEVLHQLPRLSVLSLSHNHLRQLPDSVGDLSLLRVLDLTHNRVTALPRGIGRLANLEELYAGTNLITSLPDPVGQLERLRVLNLSDNRLTTLPESVGHLGELRRLNVTSNRMAALPESLRNLTSLEELYLHGNEALGLPEEVLGFRHDSFGALVDEARPAKAQEILEYYFRVRGGGRPLNEAKLILVGRGEAGKTSVVNRIVKDVFKVERKTEGIKITDWNLRLEDGSDVRLNVWDFGGQEIMHATHQFFLTQRSLYLLVLNGREGGEDADAEYWLKLIESFGGDSPVIVVLNKIKEHPFDVNRRALRQKYPSVREFVKTDCKTGDGIEELRKAVRRETDRLEHLRDAFPASWFVIKERLGSTKKSFLSFEDYRKICAQHGEKNPHAQEALAFYLHSLGIALNYKDDPRLRDTHVLNPHWATNGIYKILNSEKLAERAGEINLEEASEILDRRKYPAGMHRFLFDLMKKFELCFSFPDEDTHYLIPELLDKQEPPDTAEFKPETCLNFQYHYPFIAEGLLPRFIVRTHALSEGLPRWRTGVIIQFEGCRALVKADINDKKVFVSVSGAGANRRRLLAVIRSDFGRIHRDIRNLTPDEMVPVPGHPDVVVAYQKLLAMEDEGIGNFPEFAGGKLIKVDVEDLLNGVDLEGARRRARTPDDHVRPVRLFYSYSHKDEALRNELETHLKLLQREGLIGAWHDRKIEAGGDWAQEIDENLERADIILLLVSADFIASDYCYEKEMARALERGREGKARVVPVIVRDVSWRKAPFAKLQALPKDGLAVTKWGDRDSAWRNVSEGIESVVEEIRKDL